MKRFFLLLLLIPSLSILSAQVQRTTQGTTSCGFKIPPKSVLKSQFQSVYEAAGIVNSMLDSIDWKENFRLREQNGINNAYATIIQNMRYIIYDNDFLENLDAYAATKFASISVLAHEMGHHYYNHMVTGSGSTVPVELEADGFSGYVMNKIGATLQQSIAAMQAIASEKASTTHPAKKDRLAAITRGWNSAQNTGTPIPENTPNNGGTTDPQTDATWIGLSIQSTKNETVYLSDDGKAYQPAELKVGEPFIFKFEIYNYGWLRLPYSNGYRTFKLYHGKDYTILWNRRTRNWTLVEVPQ